MSMVADIALETLAEAGARVEVVTQAVANEVEGEDAKG